MRKAILILVFATVGVLCLLIFLKFKAASRMTEATSVHEFELITLENDTVIFNKELYPGKLIFNFYSSDCTICMAEMSDIVSFSRKYNIDVLFVTADSLNDMRNFAKELNSLGMRDVDKISFAKIDLQDADKLFGDLTVPQTIAFTENLNIRKIKKGIITSGILRKSFE